MRRNILLILGFPAFFPAVIYAQEDKRWALQYSDGVLTKPVLTSNPLHSSTGNGSSFSVMGEYYLPEKWRLQAGYFRTDIDYGSEKAGSTYYGNGSRTMEGFQTGVKKYFLDPGFIIQPYLSGGVQLNWSRHTEHWDLTYEGVHKRQQAINPRISFVPGAGAELYLFSSIAFTIQYNFNIGLNSSTTLETSGGQSYVMKDNGMFHNLELGFKISFPFTVTERDGQTIAVLFSTIWDALLDRY